MVGGRDGGSRRTAARGGAAAQRDLLEGREALDAIGVAEWLALGRTVDVGNELAAIATGVLVHELLPVRRELWFVGRVVSGG